MSYHAVVSWGFDITINEKLLKKLAETLANEGLSGEVVATGKNDPIVDLRQKKCQVTFVSEPPKSVGHTVRRIR